MKGSRDGKAAGLLGQADEFVVAYEDIAARPAASMEVLRRKFAAPIRRVLYQDLESTIWSLWNVAPGDVTVNHIGHCLDVLSRESEGGVELDRVSSEANGIDYARLLLLIRHSRVNSEGMSAGPKVPRKEVSRAMIDLPSEAARSQVEKTDRESHPGTLSASAPTPPRKPGRPAKIGVALKEAAAAAKERGGTWKEVARILYGTQYPTGQQVKNAPNILGNYKKRAEQLRKA